MIHLANPLSKAIAVSMLSIVLPLSAAPLESPQPGGLSRAANAESDARAGPDLPKAGVLDRATATDVPNQSKTIEMLLEMQGKNPGLAAGERARQEEPAVTRQAAETLGKVVAPFAVGDPANPFGGPGGAAQPVRPTSRDEAVEWTQPTASRFGGGVASTGSRPDYGGAGGAGASAGSGDEDDVRWLIPRPLVRFVRQNRELVIGGSLLLLAILWGAAAVSSSRRK